MKISKLFHWLYAFLMLMPVFFIGGRVLYTVFNKNAKDSYSGNYGVTYKYQSNEVNNASDLINGNIYNFNLSYAWDNDNYWINQTTDDWIFLEVVDTNNYILDTIFEEQITKYQNGPKVYLYFDGYLNVYLYLYNNNDTPGDLDAIAQYSFDDIHNTYLTVKYNTDYKNGQAQLNYVNFSYSNYNEIESVDTTGTLDNAFSYSVNQLNENVLFSWAKDSFLVTPFAYITGLFGLEATSPINTLLSYWLSISIIWLVFDLVMYLPLLFHRWLDKGVLE